MPPSTKRKRRKGEVLVAKEWPVRLEIKAYPPATTTGEQDKPGKKKKLYLVTRGDLDKALGQAANKKNAILAQDCNQMALVSRTVLLLTEFSLYNLWFLKMSFRFSVAAASNSRISRREKPRIPFKKIVATNLLGAGRQRRHC